MSTVSPSQSLFAKPLQLSVIVLAWLVIAQTVGLALMGLLQAPAWVALAGTAVAALLLLLPNQAPAPSWRILPGTVLAMLTGIWLYSATVHGVLPFDLWPGGPAMADHWLLLALLVLLVATLACFIERSPHWREGYAEPVFWSAWLVYGWTLLGTLALFARSWTLYLSGSLAVLIIALFPLSGPLLAAAAVRGIGVAMLSTLLIASLPGPEYSPYWGTSIAVGWAYGLWLLGNLALPRWNARFPNWTVAPDAWPWLGLLVLVLGLALMGWRAILNWTFMLALSAYLLLLLRNSAWPGFAWLGVLTLAWAGVAAGVAYNVNAPTALRPAALTGLAGTILAWANLLLLAVPWWERQGERLAVWLGWRFAGLRAPLLTGAFSLIVFWLLVLLGWDLLGLLFPTREPAALLLGGLVSISLLHGCYRWRFPLAAHGLILAVFGTLLAGWEWLQPFSLPLFLALWGIAVIGLNVLLTLRTGELSPWLGQSLAPWATFSPYLTLLAFLLVAATVPERLLTLVVMILHAASLGWQRRQQSWWLFAIVLLVALLHAVWWVWLPFYQFPAVLPWTTLELAALLWLLFQLSAAADRRKDENRPPSVVEPLRAALEQVAPWIGVLAVAEWIGHAAEFAFTLAVGLPHQPPLLGNWGNVAALAGAGLLIAVGIGQARRSDDPRWVYGVALLAGLAGIYLRLFWVGLAPLSVWDTAAIMGAAYGLFILQRFTLSQPVFKLVLVLPLLALLTVPWQFGSDQAALTLLTAATLYLLARRATGLETPLYLGLLALNGGIYLWTPEWAGRMGLFQLYLLPAIVTVLLLLHLHRRELKPAVLNGARLAALSTLYAAATLDVFLRPELGVFVIALVLSFVGIVLGIGLRIRAFLYSGMAFLLLNVTGQLIKLYPEQRLGRALVLMTLGVVIIGLMIGFNSKREAVLQQIRIFRADLAHWE